MSAHEEWRPVPGWEGFYEVSNQGRARSVDRTVVASNGRKMRLRGKTLRLTANRKGYIFFNPCRDGVLHQVFIHRAVLEAFVGPRPEGMEGCHFPDSNPANNHLENLRWDTRRENRVDQIRLGVDFQRNKTHCPRGHLLEGANLSKGAAKAGWRGCRACGLERSYAYRHSLEFSPRRADERYATLMKEAA